MQNCLMWGSQKDMFSRDDFEVGLHSLTPKKRRYLGRPKKTAAQRLKISNTYMYSSTYWIYIFLPASHENRKVLGNFLKNIEKKRCFSYCYYDAPNDTSCTPRQLCCFLKKDIFLKNRSKSQVSTLTVTRIFQKFFN